MASEQVIGIKSESVIVFTGISKQEDESGAEASEPPQLALAGR